MKAGDDIFWLCVVMFIYFVCACAISALVACLVTLWIR